MILGIVVTAFALFATPAVVAQSIEIHPPLSNGIFMRATSLIVTLKDFQPNNYTITYNATDCSETSRVGNDCPCSDPSSCKLSGRTVVNVNDQPSRHRLTGLRPFTEYYITVTSSLLDRPLSGSGSTDKYFPGKIHLYEPHKNTTSVELKWSAPKAFNGPDVKYIMYQVPIGNGNIKRVDFNDTKHYTTTGLTSSTTYAFYIMAFNGRYYGRPGYIRLKIE